MKRLIIIAGVINLLLTVSAAAWAAGDLSVAPVFGKVTYEDSDSNGFSDATWIGLRLQGEYELPRWGRLSQPMTVQLRYDYGMNNDAVGQDAEWQTLVPEMTTDGKISGQTLLLGVLYPVGNFRFGLGYLLDKIKETEYGFAEHRDYNGFCLAAEGRLTRDGLTKASLLYAPVLSVDDDVKGDWDNADRTAAVSYDGSYWELDLSRVFVNRERFTVTGGLTYSVLSGDGAANEDYRFLKHDLTLKQFYVKAQWQF